MIRCKICVIPDTRPDTHFVDGICSACRSYANRPQIDWNTRKAELIALLDRHNGRCIVPSSGGKDSTYQVLTLLELGADVTIVTARTCHLTPMGRANIDNLARYARTIEVVPNMTVRAKLNRLGLELVGDISWPEHASIFSTPFRMAVTLGIPLIFYGESPQNQYGGPPGTEEVRIMTRRWVTEFGGFLGLRPSDLIGQAGITEFDMRDYMLPPDIGKTEAHFLGQYIEWDSHRNAKIASKFGMKQGLPCHANWWSAENLDNAQTGIHDHMMYRKYGFGRYAQQISVDIRQDLISRAEAMEHVRVADGRFPWTYAGITLHTILENIRMTEAELFEIMDRFTNHELFHHVESERPILKEFAACSRTG